MSDNTEETTAKDAVNSTPLPTRIYDEVTKTTVKGEIVEMTSNVAYASAK